MHDQESSDEMIDIQIEDSLVRETLMVIDSANFNEDVFTLICFGLILVLVVIAGYIMPKSTVTTVRDPVINGGNLREDYNMDVYPTSPDLRFIRLGFALKIDKSKFPSSHNSMNTFSNVTYSTTIETLSEPTARFPNRIIGLPKVMQIDVFRDVEYTSRFNVYQTRIIDFTNISFKLRILNCSEYFNGIRLYAEYGQRDSTIIQGYARFIFAVLSFVCFVLMLKKLCVSQSVRLWHLEQKITIPLLALLFFYNNPYAAYSGTSEASIIFFSIMETVFDSYFNFFLLVLFDSLRYKNRKTGSCFYIPKVVFFVFQFGVALANRLYTDTLSFEHTNFDLDNTATILKWTNFFAHVLYYCYFAFTVFVSGVEIDVTERYKFNMYLGSGIASLVLLLISEPNVFSLFEATTSVEFLMKVAVKNLFSYLMLYFHWPYEILTDAYQSRDDDGNTDGTSFVNEE